MNATGNTNCRNFVWRDKTEHSPHSVDDRTLGDQDFGATSIMRVVLGRLFLLLSTLCVAGAACLWVRSYETRDGISLFLGRPPVSISVSSRRGVVTVMVLKYAQSEVCRMMWNFSSEPADARRCGQAPPPRPPKQFKWYSRSSPGMSSMRVRAVNFPLWLLMAPAVLAWSLSLYRRIMRPVHRRRLGLCLCCGYNLTGNVSGQCPECGTATRATDTNG